MLLVGAADDLGRLDRPPVAQRAGGTRSPPLDARPRAVRADLVGAWRRPRVPTRSAAGAEAHSRSTSARSAGSSSTSAGEDEVQQPQQGQVLRRRLEPIDRHDDVRRAGDPAPVELLADHPQGRQRRPCLECLGAPAVALVQDALELADARTARGARRRAPSTSRPRRRPASCTASRRPNMPSRARSSSRISSPSGFRSGSRNRSADSSRSSRRASGSAASVAQPAELLLAQRRAGLGDQPGDRDDPRGELADAAVGAVAGGDRTGRVEGVQPGRADLVRPRQHDDRVDRRGMGHGAIDERLEELDVRPVEVAHQVEDGVRVAGPVAVVVEQGLASSAPRCPRGRARGRACR